ncbi:MAG: hypothetical protein LBM75_06390 [Myxococcales bacterium]|jgi:two-component system sensor histidine kinase RstB|nr:hypothetical protein [Myxococcales bacterium]
MNRIALRFTVGVLLAFTAASMTWTGFIYWRANISMVEPWQPPSEELLFKLLEQALSHPKAHHLSAEELAQRIEQSFGQPTRLISLDDPSLFEAHRHLLHEGKSAFRLDQGFIRTYYFPIEGETRVLAIGPTKSKKPLTPIQFTAFLIILLLVVGGTGLFISLPVMRLMNSMEKAAIKIMNGDLSARIDSHWCINKDIAPLVDCFNRMAEHNQELFQKHQYLLQMIAHELRTPASRMRFGLEMLAMATSDEQKEDRLQALDADLDELDAFVEELVAFNRIEYGVSEVRRSAVPLAALFETERSALVHLVGGCAVELTGMGDLSVQAEPRLLARVIRNLLANALRHAKAHVKVSCEATEAHVRIHVDDDGPGIPREARAHIFEPFTRMEASRSKSSGGLGLGLAIVQRIVRLHGATIEIADAPLGGARFTLDWPRAANAAPKATRDEADDPESDLEAIEEAG